MRRRNFISLLGGAAAAWPLAARAQPRERTRRIGVLVGLGADDSQAQARNAAFLQGLGELGWIVGRNLQIDFRWGGGNARRYRRQAAELVALAPELIVAMGASVVGPLLQTTRTVPIVFVQVTDPVSSGYVASLARPGGNATGFALFEFGISAKWIELLKEIAPRVTRAAVLRDPTVPVGLGQLGAIQSVAPSLKVEISPLGVRDARDIEHAITAFARGSSDGLIVLPSVPTAIHRTLIVTLAAQHERTQRERGRKPDARHQAPRVHHAAWRCGSRVAARGARATAGDACMGAADLQCSNLPLIGCAFLRGASLRER